MDFGMDRLTLYIVSLCIVISAGCSRSSNTCERDAECFEAEVCHQGDCIPKGSIDSGTKTGEDASDDDDASAAADTEMGVRDTERAVEDSVSDRDSSADVASQDTSPETGIDCDAPIDLYRDADDDGYAASLTPGMQACSPQAAGWKTKDQLESTTKEDCGDANSDVHPGQEKYFGMPRSKPGNDAPFDYNCDGNVEKKKPDTHDGCTRTQSGHLGCTGAGWDTMSPPDCGKEAKYIACDVAGNCGDKPPKPETQKCR